MKASAPAAFLVLAPSGMGKSSGPKGGSSSADADADVELAEGSDSFAWCFSVHPLRKSASTPRPAANRRAHRRPVTQTSRVDQPVGAETTQSRNPVPAFLWTTTRPR